ncbi:MAG: hypothetical protein LAT65_12200 [Saccharospirillum sp.]|nr:hypothetical protein [Saccharospirillum sp.]
MKRNTLIALNSIFFVLALWALVVRVVLPFIETANIFGVAETFKAFGLGSALFVMAPMYFGWMIINILRQSKSIVLYVGSYGLLLLAVVVLATGFILLSQGEQSGAMAVATIAAAFLLLVTAWLNGRILKEFKATASTSAETSQLV